MRKIVLFAALYGLWLLLSGHYTPLLLALGAISSALVVSIAHRLRLDDEEGVPLGFVPALWRFWPWLGGEIAKANLDVIRIIIAPRLAISPVLVRFTPTQRTPVGLVTHANSITLTPGTVTVEIEDDGSFLVHALTREFGEGVARSVGAERVEGDMGRRITALEAA